MSRRSLSLLLALVALLATATATRAGTTPDPASWVNPFVGTDASAQDFGTGGGAGNTYPGATTPFGMVQWSPDTQLQDLSYVGGYRYRDDHLMGFGLTHLSGAGCAVYRDLPFLPTTAPMTSSPAQLGTNDLASQYQPAFDHRHESASPGSYRVVLDPGTRKAITTELSATTRTGAARLTFPRSSTAGVLVNAGGSQMANSSATVHVDPARRGLSGSASSGRFCFQGGDYTVYFAAVFDRPFSTWSTWQKQALTQHGTDAHDTAVLPESYGPVPGGPKTLPGDPSGTAQAGAYVGFDTRRDPVVQVRVGVSFVSVDQARRNLAAEQPRFAFDTVRAKARQQWNALLGRARVSGGSAATTRTFSTALYHALLQPRTFSDVDGSYPGMDGRVHRARGFTKYADYSGWDVYRSQVPLLALLAPDRASDLVSSLLADAAESGWLPKWPFANQQTDVMTGDPADPTIATAYALGARHFDTAAALRAMVKGATVAYVGNGYVERPGLTEYQNLGYVPAEEEHHLGGIGSVASRALVWGPSATTLEYAVADFAVGAFARASCRQDASSEELLARSSSWRNVLNPTSGYAEPRSLTGAFSPTYDPTSGDGFVEGDGAQYTWHVLHDPAALIRVLGGKAKAAQRLDTFFTQLNAGPASPYAFLGNEPTLHTPYLYDWVGQPWKGQRVIRQAMTTLFGPTPGGMPGNDDLGTMSAWWVLSALGFYPVMPGTGVLALGTPLFPHVVLDLPRGRVTLDAPGAQTSPYVDSLTVDGRAHPQPWLDVSALHDGAQLHFTMSQRPATGWGTTAPPRGPPRCRPAPAGSTSRQPADDFDELRTLTAPTTVQSPRH